MLAKHKVNQNLVYGYIVLYVINFALAFTAIPEVISSIFSIITFIVGLVFIFSLRTSLQELINEGSNEPVHLSGILTFFFYAIYFQYKINEAIDNQK